MIREKICEINELTKNFGTNRILNNVSFQIEQGEFVSVMGRSGCGKSTLLYCISGMDEPTSGTVQFKGKEIFSLTNRQMESIRLKNMGFVFQKPAFLKNLSILDNILFPCFQLGERERKEGIKDALNRMEKMGIGAIAESDVREVSGGQLQRAAICRAMINQPDILFGDEPTGALNSSATGEVMEILTEINRKGTTVFLVTHDAKVAQCAERVIYLEDGQIKDVLLLGKYKEAEERYRSEKMSSWLQKMGF